MKSRLPVMVLGACAASVALAIACGLELGGTSQTTADGGSQPDCDASMPGALVEAGWRLVLLPKLGPKLEPKLETDASCPEQLDNDDWVTNPVLVSGACGCSCEPGGGPGVCGPTFVQARKGGCGSDGGSDGGDGGSDSRYDGGSDGGDGGSDGGSDGGDAGWEVPSDGGCVNVPNLPGPFGLAASTPTLSGVTCEGHRTGDSGVSTEPVRLCAPKASTGWCEAAPTVTGCLLHEGAVSACPVGYGSQRQIARAAVGSCEACACAAPPATCSGGTVSIFKEDNCMGLIDAAPSDGGCFTSAAGPKPELKALSFSVNPPAKATLCAGPTDAGGTASLSAPWTLCCP